MALNAYLTATQSLIADLAAQRFQASALTTFINTGRSQIALQGECVRFLYGGPFDGITPIPAGTFNGTTLISGVASTTGLSVGMALAGTHIVAGATIASFVPNTSITMSVASSGSGTNAFTAQLVNQTVAGQEVYALPQGPSLYPSGGINALIGCRQVSINYGGVGANQYALRWKDWAWFQGFARSYPNLTGNPVWWTRYQNNIYLRPIPSAVYPMQWDCQATPLPLAADTDIEAIPYSFTDAIPYWGAYLAYLQAQRKDDAKVMKSLADDFVKAGRKNMQSTFVPDIYEQVDGP